MNYTIADGIKSELAEKMALMQSAWASFEAQGSYFAVDTDGDGVLDQVFHAEETRQWNPWHDTAVAIPIEDCFDHDGLDYEDCDAEWAMDGMLETVEAE